MTASGAAQSTHKKRSQGSSWRKRPGRLTATSIWNSSSSFDGSMIPDHIPVFVEDAGKWAHKAYTIGYTRALLQRTVAEKGRP